MSSSTYQQSRDLENKVVTIDWYADDHTVRVVGKSHKRFEIHKDRAIEVLQMAKDRELFEKQFDLLISRVGEWAGENVRQIKSVFLTLRDTCLMLIVETVYPGCNDDFEDSLTQFELDVANDTDLNLICLNTMALPSASADSLSSFFDDRLLVKLQTQGAH